MERHTRFEVFLKMYEALATSLHAILCPHDYSQVVETEILIDTKVKAPKLKLTLQSPHFSPLLFFVHQVSPLK